MGQILHKKGKTAVKHSILWKENTDFHSDRMSWNKGNSTLISQGKEVKKSSSDIGIKPKKFRSLKVKGRQCFKKEWMNEQGTPSNTKWSKFKRPENDHRSCMNSVSTVDHRMKTICRMGIDRTLIRGFKEKKMKLWIGVAVMFNMLYWMSMWEKKINWLECFLLYSDNDDG